MDTSVISQWLRYGRNKLDYKKKIFNATGACWGLCCLPSFPPFDWRLWWSAPVLPAINAFSSLFSVVFSVLFWSFPVGLDSAFLLLIARL
jgi:hypothetical protein